MNIHVSVSWSTNAIFFGEGDILGCPDRESGGCYFGTFEHFFLIQDYWGKYG